MSKAAYWDGLAKDLTYELSNLSLESLEIVVLDGQQKKYSLSLRCDLVLDTPRSLWIALSIVGPAMLAAVRSDGMYTLSPGWRLPLRLLAAHDIELPVLVVWKALDAPSASLSIRTLLEGNLGVAAGRVRLISAHCSPAEAERRAGVRASVRRVQGFGVGSSAAMSNARCDKCGQPLTDPDSIRVGLGPWCRASYGHEYLQAMRDRVIPTRMSFSGKTPGEWLRCLRTDNKVAGTAPES